MDESIPSFDDPNLNILIQQYLAGDKEQRNAMLARMRHVFQQLEAADPPE